jgi:hypothetical protein
MEIDPKRPFTEHTTKLRKMNAFFMPIYIIANSFAGGYDHKIECGMKLKLVSSCIYFKSTTHFIVNA